MEDILSVNGHWAFLEFPKCGYFQNKSSNLLYLQENFHVQEPVPSVDTLKTALYLHICVYSYVYTCKCTQNHIICTFLCACMCAYQVASVMSDSMRPMDYSLLVTPVSRILQARVLEFPWPPPGYLPHSGIKLRSLTSLTLAGRSSSLVPPGKHSFPLILLSGSHNYETHGSVLTFYSSLWLVAEI